MTDQYAEQEDRFINSLLKMFKVDVDTAIYHDVSRGENTSRVEIKNRAVFARLVNNHNGIVFYRKSKTFKWSFDERPKMSVHLYGFLPNNIILYTRQEKFVEPER